MPRCCDPADDDFEPSYASVLVAGGGDCLRRKIQSIEEDELICPCVTGWCPGCKRVSALVAGRDLFPRPSAYYAHAMVLRERLEGTLAAFGQRAN